MKHECHCDINRNCSAWNGPLGHSKETGRRGERIETNQTTETIEINWIRGEARRLAVT